MNARNIGIIFRKELTDTMRDRRTLISSILMPILLFPLLMAAIAGIGFFVISRATRQVSQVMLIGEENAPALAKRIRKIENVEVVPESKDYAAQINEKKLRVAVEFPAGLETNLYDHPEQPQSISVYWFDGELRSQTTLRAVEKSVRAYRDELVNDRLSARKLTSADATPFGIEKKNVATAEKVTGNILGFILHYFVIILCLTGAMYPAMDLTAGEKERGTMETILASPTGRTELVLGKFLLVLLTSVVTTALAITSFALTVVAGAGVISRLDKDLVLAVSVPSAVAVFVMVLPLAMTFSALLIAISLKARSYREAQGYLAPLMFLVILPALGSMIPGIELNARLALVPILNVSLVAKEIFAGQYPWRMIGLIFASTSVIAALALHVAIRQFRREEVIFRT